MGEQDNGRNRAGASDDQAAGGTETASPTGDGPGAAPQPGSAVRVSRRRDRAAAVRVGRAVRAIMNLLAVLVRLVACLFAVVLVVRIGIAFVAVNPHNVIVEWIIRVADVIVLDFRDLFLPSDPRIRLAVNYGLAAVFWLAAGMSVAWVLTGVGRLAASRPRR